MKGPTGRCVMYRVTRTFPRNRSFALVSFSLSSLVFFFVFFFFFNFPSPSTFDLDSFTLNVMNVKKKKKVKEKLKNNNCETVKNFTVERSGAESRNTNGDFLLFFVLFCCFFFKVVRANVRNGPFKGEIQVQGWGGWIPRFFLLLRRLSPQSPPDRTLFFFVFFSPLVAIDEIGTGGRRPIGPSSLPSFYRVFFPAGGRGCCLQRRSTTRSTLDDKKV